jgi:AbrB family looped-hinge helix DNA binding protein
MRTTIDRAGRIVVPKTLRDALGLTGGQEVELSAHGGNLEIRVAPTSMRLESKAGHVVAVADAELPPLTVELVRDALEQSRR